MTDCNYCCIYVERSTDFSSLLPLVSATVMDTGTNVSVINVTVAHSNSLSVVPLFTIFPFSTPESSLNFNVTW